MDTFEQGEDILRTVTLTVDGSVADTADFLTIVVRVYHKKNHSEMGSYSVAGGTVTKETPTTAGIITFIVLSTENQSEQTGVYAYEIETTETDTDYPSNRRTRKFIGDCFRLMRTNE